MKFYDSLETIGMRDEDFMDDSVSHDVEFVVTDDGRYGIFWPFDEDDSDY